MDEPFIQGLLFAASRIDCSGPPGRCACIARSLADKLREDAQARKDLMDEKDLTPEQLKALRAGAGPKTIAALAPELLEEAPPPPLPPADQPDLLVDDLTDDDDGDEEDDSP